MHFCIIIISSWESVSWTTVCVCANIRCSFECACRLQSFSPCIYTFIWRSYWRQLAVLRIAPYRARSWKRSTPGGDCVRSSAGFQFQPEGGWLLLFRFFFPSLFLNLWSQFQLKWVERSDRCCQLRRTHICVINHGTETISVVSFQSIALRNETRSVYVTVCCCGARERKSVHDDLSNTLKKFDSIQWTKIVHGLHSALRAERTWRE